MNPLCKAIERSLELPDGLQIVRQDNFDDPMAWVIVIEDRTYGSQIIIVISDEEIVIKEHVAPKILRIVATMIPSDPDFLTKINHFWSIYIYIW